MSSNSFASVSFATAMLKMKTLPTGFPVALCSTAIQFSDRHSNRNFLLLRIVDLLVDVCCSGRIGLRDCRVSAKRASCSLRHCFNATANSGRCRRGFLRPISIQTKKPMFGVLQNRSAFVELRLTFFDKIVVLFVERASNCTNSKILVAVEEAFLRPISIQTKNPMFGVLQNRSAFVELRLTFFDKIVVLFVERASNCTKILYSEGVLKYFCMARFLLVTSRIGFLPSHLDYPSDSQ